MAKHRVCVIGNSHAAALRLGLDGLPELQESLAFDFFAAQSGLMRHMAPDGRRLVPTSGVTRQRLNAYSQGRSEIEIDRYDSFLLVGLGFGIDSPSHTSPFAVFRRFQIHGLELEGAGSGTYISRPCFAALTESILKNSTANYYAAMLRKLTDAPIHVVPAPYPSETVLKPPHKAFWRQSVENGAWVFVTDTYRDKAEKVVSGGRCRLLSQPSHTLTDALFTREEYSRDSVRLSNTLDQEHPPDEPYHMNGRYGAEVLVRYSNELGRTATAGTRAAGQYEQAADAV